MTEVENLMLEHLKAIRADIATLRDDMHGMRVEMTAMRQQMASMFTMQEHHHSEIASLKARISRIETRLDLVD
ncbi:MAG: hypothetical protein AAF763_03115 [Pseudomonadota bacterium]